MLRNDGGGFFRARVTQIHEFFRIRSMEPHEGDVDESEDIGETAIQHSPPEFGKVCVARAARVHRRGDAVSEANQRIHAIKIALVPVAMKIDEPGADNLAAHIKYPGRCRGRNIRRDRSNLAFADGDIRSAGR